ncbi:MAG: hypothetical protein K8R23_14190 [Chthoniobacter sp.]|nr:hypothetical protein [Chthoniobacter sp.]
MPPSFLQKPVSDGGQVYKYPQNLVAGFTNGLRDVPEGLAGFTNGLRHVREGVAGITDGLRDVRESVVGVTSGLRDVREGVAGITNGLRHVPTPFTRFTHASGHPFHSSASLNTPLFQPQP